MDAADSLDALDTLGLDLEYATGLIAALHTGPEFVPPDTWVPVLLDEEVELDNQDQAQQALTALMNLYNEITDLFGKHNQGLAPDLNDSEAVESFCTGYLRGARLQRRWFDDEIGVMMLFPFAALAGEVTDEDLLDDEERPMNNPEEWRQTQRGRLPEYIADLYAYWAPARATVTAPRRPGRNDPCPCGSGKKYKKCCALTERST